MPLDREPGPPHTADDDPDPGQVGLDARDDEPLPRRLSEQLLETAAAERHRGADIAREAALGERYREPALGNVVGAHHPPAAHRVPDEEMSRVRRAGVEP